MMQEYGIHLDPLFSTLQVIDVRDVVNGADHDWYNQTLIQVGDVLVRLGVFQPGEFHWHQHEEQDEFFLVLDGQLRIELENHVPVDLLPRQAFSVPAALLHRPSASMPTTVLMIEKAGVTPTGDHPCSGPPNQGHRSPPSGSFSP